MMKGKKKRIIAALILTAALMGESLTVYAADDLVSEEYSAQVVDISEDHEQEALPGTAENPEAGDISDELMWDENTDDPAADGGLLEDAPSEGLLEDVSAYVAASDDIMSPDGASEFVPTDLHWGECNGKI